MSKQTIRGRIMQFIDYENISNADLERDLELSSGAFRKVKNLSSAFLAKFVGKYPSISCEWLLRGEGKMLLDKKQPNLPNEIIIKREIFEQIAKLTETVLSQQRTIELMQKEKHHVHVE